MIGFSVDEFSKIITAVNLLTVFVNKAMKDGFTLKVSSPPPPKDLQFATDSSVYLRLFWQSISDSDRLGIAVPAMAEVSDENHGRSTLYSKPKITTLDTLILGQSLEFDRLGFGFSFGFGFCVTAAKSHDLITLEKSWIRGFPSFTVPLLDWQIFEEMELKFSPVKLSKSSIVPHASHLQAKKEGWRSMMLKGMTLPSPWPILKTDPAKTNGPHTWLIDGREYISLLGIRRDWEFRHYGLKTDPKNIPKDPHAKTDMK